MAADYVTFRKYATIFMAGMTGIMIAYPFALSQIHTPVISYLILFSALLAGFVIGFRRRNSVIFLYFCMLAVIILAVVISSSLEFSNR